MNFNQILANRFFSANENIEDSWTNWTTDFENIKLQIHWQCVSGDWTLCFLIPITHYYLSTPIQGLPNSFSDNNKNISALACGEPLQNFLALIMKHYKYCLTCFQIHAVFQVQNCSQSSHTINEVIWMHKLFEVGKILHFHFKCFK